VLHRDIKPDNIILSATGAKIADFGIARVPDSTLTRDGGLLGTPAYSSPESIATGEFSPLSDQFSMAATLYEAIAGTRAFPGQDAVAVATKISTEEPLPVAASRGLGPKVDEILARALAKRAQARFSSATQFGHALAQALAESRARTSMATIPDQRRAAEGELVVQRSQSRRSALGGAALGALLTIAGFQLTAQLKSQGPPSETASPTQPNAEPSGRNTELTERSPPVGWLAASPPKPLPKTSANKRGTRQESNTGRALTSKPPQDDSKDRDAAGKETSAPDKAAAALGSPTQPKAQAKER
jgi:serine/threonine-protein kinase